MNQIVSGRASTFPDTVTAAPQRVHPGEILREEFLEPMGITAYRLAKAVGLSQTHIGDLLRGERDVTANVALRLAAFFGTTPDLWMNLQTAHDLAKARITHAEALRAIERVVPPHVRDMDPDLCAAIEAEQIRPRVAVGRTGRSRGVA